VPVDPRAAQAFSATAALYDRVRPSYPPAAVRAAADALALHPAATVLDLAAGTGKLTAVLLDVLPRAKVLAVDPSPRMLAVLRRRLPAVPALEGDAAAIPLADASVAAVFVGEALHWFDIERSAPELARVLTADGGLALLWNRLRTGADADPRVRAVRELLAPHRAAAGEFPAAGVDVWGPALVASGGFAPPRRLEVAPHEQTLPADDFVALASTWSWVVNLAPPVQAMVLMQAREIVGGRPVTLTHDVEAWVVDRRAEAGAASPASRAPLSPRRA
jgi:SAM-dependent methyltransferase